MTFEEFFKKATGLEPFPYQARMAVMEDLPSLLHLPTGSGKTLSVIATWLWRRRFADIAGDMPRRLVYCLPLRVLVDQTYREACSFIKRIGIEDEVGVSVLMGGDVEQEWQNSPEEENIIIGTQDMLLSRVLNRGYAQSRFMWPVSYALLNNDCLWVLDEVQLMGNGLATSAQLESFRQRLGAYGSNKTMWMSATLNREWLRTFDFQEKVDGLTILDMGKADLKNKILGRRFRAPKILAKIPLVEAKGEMKALAKCILEKHEPGSQTLVVLNTVDRASELFKLLQMGISKTEKGKSEAKRPSLEKPCIILIHSRFRGKDRQEKEQELNSEGYGPEGRIVVSTQVVEAGVDITSHTLFTELAPWPSMVQRFGRCNRYGENRVSHVFWIDLPAKKYPPYSEEEMERARERLIGLEGDSVGPDNLSSLAVEEGPNYSFVIRSKDFRELFDNTPDLSGNDIDVSRFIREADALDLHVFWRDFEGVPPQDTPPPLREEMCPVPFNKLRDWINDGGLGFSWNPIEGEWVKVVSRELRPGIIIIIPSNLGGYSPDRGWTGEHDTYVPPLDIESEAYSPESTGADNLSTGHAYPWISIREHADHVCDELEAILSHMESLLPDDHKLALRWAAQLHDIGKASGVFQNALSKNKPVTRDKENELWAKGPSEGRLKYGRKYFRHELVSAMLLLSNSKSLKGFDPGRVDLVAYLVAAHHGKVRLRIKALPQEEGPQDRRLFALGVWEGDQVPSVDLGYGLVLPETEIDLNCMELGSDNEESPSWAERCLSLLKNLGPLRLAFLEALLRVADIRASVKEVEGLHG